MKNGTSKSGRPETKAKLRNFKLRKDLDEFLSAESTRTGRDMTFILERLLERSKQMKPSVRDAEILKQLEAA
jgi:chromosomal replication initiation ATPase DnaA